MSKTIVWRKGILYSSNSPIGRRVKINDDSVAYSMNGVDVEFLDKGFMTKRAVIKGADNHSIGEIIKKKWSKRARITFKNGNEYLLKKTGLFSRKWKMTAGRNPIMDFHFSLTKGEINYLFEDEILILSGLYVINGK